eukprot:629977-Pelagomonas_calceolata.AAC.2
MRKFQSICVGLKNNTYKKVRKAGLRKTCSQQQSGKSFAREEFRVPTTCLEVSAVCELDCGGFGDTDVVVDSASKAWEAWHMAAHLKLRACYVHSTPTSPRSRTARWCKKSAAAMVGRPSASYCKHNIQLL